MKDKYVKIVYQTEPIGKEKIVLYLTTFDVEAFERGKKLEKQRKAKVFEINKKDFDNPEWIYHMQEQLNDYVKRYYEPYVEKMRGLIETQKAMLESIPIPMQTNEKNLKNITNSEDVYCNTVYGNITNCENVYCNEVKGNVVNCESIIYK